MTVEQLDTRFRVYREDNVVTFLGCISDTPNLAILDGILADGCVCDFAKVTFASWIGLFQIGYYIKNKKFNLTFTNVNYQIYDSMRMIKPFEEQQIHSAEIPVVTKSDLSVQFKVVEIERFREHAMEGLEWQSLDGDQQILNPLRFVYPDINMYRNNPDMNLLVSSERLTQCGFLLKYALYAVSTMKMSEVLAGAAKLNIMEFTREIKAKLASGEMMLKIIDPSSNYTLVSRINEMLVAIDASFLELEKSTKPNLESAFLQMARIVQSSIVSMSEQEYLGNFASFAKEVANIHQVANKCEDCGSAIGAQLGSLRAAQVLKMSLNSVMEVDSQQLAAIRDAFAIMDILSEDDWHATREIIMDEIEQIESYIGRCIVALQGFDMMRQILEHRIQEMEIVNEFVAGCGTEGLLEDFIKSQILEKISKHMVTEQEKVAFEFYFPDEFAANANTKRAEPGDVLLF